MKKILGNILPTTALGIAGYSQINSLKEQVKDLQNKVNITMTFMVIQWLIILGILATNL